MVARDPLPAQSQVDNCPSCSEPCDTPSLLTSMVRYYVCGRCARRWQVARDPDNDATSGGTTGPIDS
jgi:hypothetical protein